MNSVRRFSVGMARLGRGGVFVVVFLLVLLLLSNCAPYRGPVRLELEATADHPPLPAQVEFTYPDGRLYTEEFIFRKRDTGPDPVGQATLHLPTEDIAAVRLRSSDPARPLQLRTARAVLPRQARDLTSASSNGVTTLDLAATDIYHARIASQPLLRVAYVLAALGAAWLVSRAIGPRQRAVEQATKRAVRATTATAEGPSPLLQRAGLFSAVLVGVSAGLQLTLIGLILIGPMKDLGARDQLTQLGAALFAPEYDLPIYVAGCALTVGLGILAGGLWTRWARRLQLGLAQAGIRHCLAYALVLQLSLSAFSMAVFMLLLFGRYSEYRQYRPPTTGIVEIGALFVPALALLLCVPVDLRRLRREVRREASQTPSSPPQKGTGTSQASVFDGGKRVWLGASPLLQRTARWQGVGRAGLDWAIPALIIGVLYIPASLWSFVAGQCAAENLLHWSFFIMNPAVAYASGQALGTEAYTQYGAGWPLLFGSLDSVLPLAFANIIGASVIYACAYYIGVYIFLRLALSNAAWAAAGTLASLLLQVFNGIDLNSSPWICPSSTCLRHPIDIWFFIALPARGQSQSHQGPRRATASQVT